MLPPRLVYISTMVCMVIDGAVVNETVDKSSNARALRRADA